MNSTIVTSKHAERLSRFDVPNLRCLVVGARHRKLPVGGKTHAQDSFGVSAEFAVWLHCRHKVRHGSCPAASSSTASTAANATHVACKRSRRWARRCCCCCFPEPSAGHLVLCWILPSGKAKPSSPFFSEAPRRTFIKLLWGELAAAAAAAAGAAAGAAAAGVLRKQAGASPSDAHGSERGDQFRRQRAHQRRSRRWLCGR